MPSIPLRAPDSVFFYRGKHIAVYAVPLENTDEEYGCMAVIDGFLYAPPVPSKGMSHGEAVDRARHYARQLIDGDGVDMVKDPSPGE